MIRLQREQGKFFNFLAVVTSPGGPTMVLLEPVGEEWESLCARVLYETLVGWRYRLYAARTTGYISLGILYSTVFWNEGLS
jgi:hypothetical protein